MVDLPQPVTPMTTITRSRPSDRVGKAVAWREAIMETSVASLHREGLHHNQGGP
jgi:hypothetical protein